jgi:hypothetical protein
VTLVDWWVHAPERVSPKVPSVLKALLVPWFGIGFVIVLIPELQQMPDLIRGILVAPFALAGLWMAVGMTLSMADKLVAFGAFIRKKAR